MMNFFEKNNINNIKEFTVFAEKKYNQQFALAPDKESALYMSLTMFMIIVFVFFGIIPQIKVYQGVKDYHAELSNQRKIMRDRKVNITNLRKQLNEGIYEITYFDSIMPVGLQAHEFLFDINQAVSEAGFILEGMNGNTAPENPTVHTVNIKLTGTNEINSIVQVLKNIEKLQRITSVENLNVTINNNEYEVVAGLKVYSRPAK